MANPDAPTLAVSDARYSVLHRRIRFFVAATIGYNVIEAAVAITAGKIASSSALIGFGLDAVVEVASATAVAWQFSAKDPETREKTALRIIAVSFFALAAVITLDAIRSLWGGVPAEHSVPGMVLAALSLAVMPVLSWLQRRAGRELGSRSAVADSKQTLLCTYLSAVLLIGLLLNAWLGWAWADPVAALIIAAVAVKEGLDAWTGDACCAPNAHVMQSPAADEAGLLNIAGKPATNPVIDSAGQAMAGCACCAQPAKAHEKPPAAG